MKSELNIEQKVAGHSERIQRNYRNLKEGRCEELTLVECSELVFLGLAKKIVEDQEYWIAL